MEGKENKGESRVTYLGNETEVRRKQGMIKCVCVCVSVCVSVCVCVWREREREREREMGQRKITRWNRTETQRQFFF